MMIRIGDVVPYAPPQRALYVPGPPDTPPRWYALRCAPLREEAAARHLKDRGVPSFFPVKVKVVTIRGRKMERRQMFLPGYLFAAFPGAPLWHRVIDHDDPKRLIRGVLCLASGTPGELREDDLADLKALAARDDKAEAEAKARATVKVGDLVRLPDLIDPDGAPRVVVGLTAKGGVVVRLTLFGRINDVAIEHGAVKVAP